MPVVLNDFPFKFHRPLPAFLHRGNAISAPRFVHMHAKYQPPFLMSSERRNNRILKQRLPHLETFTSPHLKIKVKF
jgi:hypothetical protein